MLEHLGGRRPRCTASPTYPAPLVDFQVEEAIEGAVRGREDDLVRDVIVFGHEYAARARTDHRLFVDGFRSGRVPGLSR